MTAPNSGPLDLATTTVVALSAKVIARTNSNVLSYYQKVALASKMLAVWLHPQFQLQALTANQIKLSAAVEALEI